MATENRMIPIYTTRGDLGAFLVYPHLFNLQGEWIGWMTSEKEVYSVLGHYVGYLGDGPRILRKRTYSFNKPRQEPLPMPKPIRVPASAPLAPMMSEITFSTIDILDEEPERLSPLEANEFLEDLD